MRTPSVALFALATAGAVVASGRPPRGGILKIESKEEMAERVGQDILSRPLEHPDIPLEANHKLRQKWQRRARDPNLPLAKQMSYKHLAGIHDLLEVKFARHRLGTDGIDTTAADPQVTGRPFVPMTTLPNPILSSSSIRGAEAAKLKKPIAPHEREAALTIGRLSLGPRPPEPRSEGVMPLEQLLDPAEKPMSKPVGKPHE